MHSAPGTAATALTCFLFAFGPPISGAAQEQSQEEIVKRIEGLWEEAIRLAESPDWEKVRSGYRTFWRYVQALRDNEDGITEDHLRERLAKVKAEEEEKRSIWGLQGYYIALLEARKILYLMKFAMARRDFDQVVELHEWEMAPLIESLITSGPPDEDMRELEEIHGRTKALLQKALEAGAKIPTWEITRGYRSKPSFPDARLKIVAPKEGETLTDRNVSVILDLKGFETGVQTEGAAEQGIANSTQGQHVKIIVDNGPAMACHDVTKPFPIGGLEPGTHVLRAFPSRSYHESVKTEGAFAMVTFHVEKATSSPIVPGEPLLTLSCPQGEYAGVEAKKILVDFYVSNVDMSIGAHDFLLTVDGRRKYVPDWKPYFVEGLGDGEHTIRLELRDFGEPVPGAFSSVERTITVKSAP